MDLQTLKNNYAEEQGYDDWSDLYRRAGYYDETIFFKHEDAVIILAEKAALKKAAEKAKTQHTWSQTPFGFTKDEAIVDRRSITNPENLIR